MAVKLDIPLIFYVKCLENMEKISHKTSSYSAPGQNAESSGFTLDPVGGKSLMKFF